MPDHAYMYACPHVRMVACFTIVHIAALTHLCDKDSAGSWGGRCAGWLVDLMTILCFVSRLLMDCE